MKFFFALVNLTEDNVTEMLKTMRIISRFEFTEVKSKSKYFKSVFYKSNFENIRSGYFLSRLLKYKGVNSERVNHKSNLHKPL